MTASILAIDGLAQTEPEFRWKLYELGQRLRIDPGWLAAVMRIESTYKGVKFNPAAFNPAGPAAGLIQFMPRTAARLGTSTNALLGMSRIEQLPYVEKFFAPWAGRLSSPGAVYMATFMPSFVGAPRDKVIAERDSSTDLGGVTSGAVYAANSVFDRDGDGRILAGDVYSTVERVVAGARGLQIKVEPIGWGIGGLLLLAGAGYFLYQRFK